MGHTSKMELWIWTTFLLVLLVVLETNEQEIKYEGAQSQIHDYAPRAPEDHMNVRAPGLGAEVIIQIKISARPEPTIDWTFGQQHKVKPEFVSKDQRIHIKSPKKIAPDLYLCQLVITSIEHNDLQTMYELHARNSAGTGKFQFQLNMPNRVEMGGESRDSDGHSPMTIVTICVLTFSVFAIFCVLCTRGAICQLSGESCECCDSYLPCLRRRRPNHN